MIAKMDQYEEALATKYGFVVTAEGDRFVVTDPQMPRKKKRYIGGNLYALLLQAIDERNTLKIEVTGDTKIKSNVIPLKKTRQPQPSVGIGGDPPHEDLVTQGQQGLQKGNKLLNQEDAAYKPKMTVNNLKAGSGSQHHNPISTGNLTSSTHPCDKEMAWRDCWVIGWRTSCERR
jgi:hypothetical protein